MIAHWIHNPLGQSRLQRRQPREDLQHLDQNPVVPAVNQNPIELRRQRQVGLWIGNREFAEDAYGRGHDPLIGALQILDQTLEGHPHGIRVQGEESERSGGRLDANPRAGAGEERREFHTEVAGEVRGGSGGGEKFEGEGGRGIARGREVLAELVRREGENGCGGGEAEGGGEIAQFLVEEERGREKLEGMECGPGDVDAMEGAEVGELLEGDGLGGRVRCPDLAADVVHGPRQNEGRRIRPGDGGSRSQGLDEVFEGALE